MCSDPVLTCLGHYTAVESVQSQVDGTGDEHPIRKLLPGEENFSTVGKECMPYAWACKHSGYINTRPERPFTIHDQTIPIEWLGWLKEDNGRLDHPVESCWLAPQPYQ